MRDDHVWAAVKITKAAVTQLFNGASTPNEVRRGQQIGEIIAELYTAIYAGIVEADYRVGKIVAAESADQETQPDAPIMQTKPPGTRPPEPTLPERKPPAPKVSERKPVEAAQRMRTPVAAPRITSNGESPAESPHPETSGTPSVMASYRSDPASAPGDEMERNRPAMAPATDLGDSVPTSAPGDEVERSMLVTAPATDLGDSVPANPFADLMERSRPAIAPATDLGDSVPASAPGDEVERSMPVTAPATDLGDSDPAIVPGDEVERSMPVTAPASDLGDSVPAMAPDDVEDSEPTKESAFPAVTMGDIWERIGSPRSSASRFFDR